MRFRNYAPDARLRGLVQDYWEMDEVVLDHHEQHHTLPERSIRLTFATGHSWRQVGQSWVKAPPATLSGLILQPQPSVVLGEVRALVAELYPWGARQLLGWNAATPQAELDALVSGTSAGREIVALLELGEWEAARQVLEAWLLSLLNGHAAEAGKGVEAAERIYRALGKVRVADLAEELNLSPRQLERLFAGQVGVSAKTLARLVRFEEAHFRIRQAPDTSVADLAFDLGFFDQAHLIKEFRALTLMTPRAFAELSARRLEDTPLEGWVPR
ncbi:AraC family transcriptional regulator [Deinococcus hopiensis]|uniref:AraC-type DNA-binding protein n=1 Tax=Deinococcus hopiensis KR-140 TaxID=695939 RepID=A0A1W1VDT2_9DEIO|nr:helix-turn-helix domain-containing protein [Deinococcus hopiensis]SMB91373.1 AraC-type DNA-binding protein [Deinococcus hopiensis KR-140]